MKFENVEVFNMEGALRGMRNPKNSWDKSDSIFDIYIFDVVTDQSAFKRDVMTTVENWAKATNQKVSIETIQWLLNNCALRQSKKGNYDIAMIGPNDMKLAQTLIKGGPEHRKFLRQIMVSVDITAPLYWY